MNTSDEWKLRHALTGYYTHFKHCFRQTTDQLFICMHAAHHADIHTGLEVISYMSVVQ